MKILATALAALSIAAMPVSAVAQAQTYSADDDLRCVAWAAMITGQMEDDKETSAAFGMIMTYFIGRYEAGTGRNIEDALTPEIVISVGEDMQAASETCGKRMEDLGLRMEGLGDALTAAADGMDG